MKPDEFPLKLLCETTRYLGPAKVLSCEGRQAAVELSGEPRSAVSTVPGYSPMVGDTALVIGDDSASFYIIGVLSTGRRTTRIQVEEGDLELVTAKGKMRFISEGGMELTSVRPVQIRSRMGVVLTVLSRVGRHLPRLSLGPAKTEVRNTEILMESDVARQQSKTSVLSADALRVDAGDLTAQARRVRFNADLVLSKVRNLYAKVTELWQLAAGRSRMVVQGTSHHKAERIYAKAVKDVKVKGEQIHLG